MRILNAALLIILSGSPAFAQRVPAIVIPGRADVPVMMNGIDVSWSVVEGDYGLDRPIGMVPTVIYRPYAVMVPGPGSGPGYGPPVQRRRQGLGPAYYPRDGRRPGYGRLEVEPPPDRPLPPPAESFFQGWGSQSAPGPSPNIRPSPRRRLSGMGAAVGVLVDDRRQSIPERALCVDTMHLQSTTA